VRQGKVKTKEEKNESKKEKGISKKTNKDTRSPRNFKAGMSWFAGSELTPFSPVGERMWGWGQLSLF